MLGLCPVCDAPLCDTGDSGIINIIQLLTFNQMPYVGKDIDLTQNQTLTFNQSLVYKCINHINQTLTFLQEVFPNQNLHFVQTVVYKYINNIHIAQSLTFEQQVEIANAYYILVCHCLQLVQHVYWGIPLSVSQTLTFHWLIPDLIQQLITFTQHLATNWDSISDCCGVLGIPNKYADNQLSFNQTVVANMHYHITVAQTLSFSNSTAWTP